MLPHFGAGGVGVGFGGFGGGPPPLGPISLLRPLLAPACTRLHPLALLIGKTVRWAVRTDSVPKPF